MKVYFAGPRTETIPVLRRLQAGRVLISYGDGPAKGQRALRRLVVPPAPDAGRRVWKQTESHDDSPTDLG